RLRDPGRRPARPQSGRTAPGPDAAGDRGQPGLPGGKRHAAPSGPAGGAPGRGFLRQQWRYRLSVRAGSRGRAAPLRPEGMAGGERCG
nr:hypothetical protein [Tanacetum cinerariifolium]